LKIEEVMVNRKYAWPATSSAPFNLRHTSCLLDMKLSFV